MNDSTKKTCVPEFLWPNGVEPTPSVGRSNCTIFLDHPELLGAFELDSVKVPEGVEVPAFKRREKVVKR